MNKNKYTRFNKIVVKFLTDLHNILPEEKDIMVFQSQISVIEMIDPSKILKSFIEYAHPYKDQIIKKDEDFFLKSGNIQGEEDFMSESIHLKDLWKNKLSAKNKEVVWKYFQVMVILSEK